MSERESLISVTDLRELWDAWQAEIRVPGSAETTAYHALEDVIFEALPGLLDAFEALNALRSNIIGTQSASWSNAMYPLVAILNAAGLEQFDPSEEQLRQHLACYGGAGGYPGHELREPGTGWCEPVGRLEDVKRAVRRFLGDRQTRTASFWRGLSQMRDGTRTERDTAYFEAAFDTVAARMMVLLTEFGAPDERWDPADAHEEIRESHPEMFAALQRNYERSKG